jgi:hypothetical protein
MSSYERSYLDLSALNSEDQVGAKIDVLGIRCPFLIPLGIAMGMSHASCAVDLRD